MVILWIIANENMNETDTDKQMAEGTYYHGTRELQGYEIFKDNAPLDFTTDTEYLDTQNLEYLTEYCYNVTAVYDLGESKPTDDECTMWEILSPDDITAEGLEAVLTNKTKIFCLINPSNPTGAITPPDEIKKIANLLKDKNIIIISDEIYGLYQHAAYKRCTVMSV